MILFLSQLFSLTPCHASPFPIQFSIPETKIVQKIPVKDQDFATVIPWQLNTYIFTREEDYYKDYQRSYFAITCKKGGWDCMRHYEILANGCIPYFTDLEKCNPDTMLFLPKELIIEAMNLEGVSYLNIDYTKFDIAKYSELLKKMLDHTRKYLTTTKMARYLLNTIDYAGNGTILYLSNDISPDYMRCITLAGLKELMPNRVIDFPKIDHIYTNYAGNIQELYGKGMSYTKIVEDLPMDRSNIEQRIRNKEFDVIIYGSVHRGMLFYDLVHQVYEPEKIVYLCGEDAHRCQFSHFTNLFLREFDAKQ